MASTKTSSDTSNTSAKNIPGVVFMSRIPPSMTPHELRAYLEPFGEIGRIYLAPDAKHHKPAATSTTPVNPRSHKKTRFTEGWIEFMRRKSAKTAALALNGSMFGGKKSNRFHDDIWCIKYLSGFKWSNLTEKVSYERALREKKMKIEISQARKENMSYIKQSERAHELSKIQETRELKKQVPSLSLQEKAQQQLKALGTQFKQRTPIIGENN